MTIGLALEYIPRRMEELGYGDRYYLRFRHLILQGTEKQQHEAFNQLFILVEEPNDVCVESDSGVFDLSLQNVNEMQYEHQGLVKVQNLSGETRHVRFIQVIPKHQTKIKSNGSSDNNRELRPGKSGADQKAVGDTGG